MVLGNAREMANDPAEVVATVASSKGYRERFSTAFGSKDVAMERILQALAAFERTLVSDGSSDFDRFLAGQPDALSDEAVRGLHLFRTKARCLNCHNGPLFSDEQFHNLGLTYYGRELEDLGRYNVTRDPADVGRFRTPSLRNLGRTGPYMHNGLFELDGVINMYSAGMPTITPKEEQREDPLFPVKSPLLQRLDLAPDERADLKAFLLSLTERKRRIRAPELPAIGDVAD
jgi:cytochrome c peroxidase